MSRCAYIYICVCVCVCVFSCVYVHVLDWWNMYWTGGICTGLVELWHCEEVTYLAASVVCFE